MINSLNKIDDLIQNINSLPQFLPSPISQPNVSTHSMGVCTRFRVAAVAGQLARNRDAQVQNTRRWDCGDGGRVNHNSVPQVRPHRHEHWLIR